MKLMRGDMGGAAVVLAALVTIAKLQLPINVVLAIPLAENMPGGKATKPGDVYENFIYYCLLLTMIQHRSDEW